MDLPLGGRLFFGREPCVCRPGGLEEEEGNLKSDVYFVATGELGLGYWDALKEANILNALVKDAQKMGGDKDYKVDIGV